MSIQITDPETGVVEQFTLNLEDPRVHRESERKLRTYQGQLAAAGKLPSQLQYCQAVDNLLTSSASGNLCLEWLKERLSQAWPRNPFAPPQTFVQVSQSICGEGHDMGHRCLPEQRESLVFPGPEISVINAILTKSQRYEHPPSVTKVLYVAYQSLSKDQYHWPVLRELAHLVGMDTNFLLGHFLPCLRYEKPLRYCKREISLQMGIPLYRTMHHLFFKRLDGGMLSVSVWIKGTYRYDYYVDETGAGYEAQGFSNVILILDDVLDNTALDTRSTYLRFGRGDRLDLTALFHHLVLEFLSSTKAMSIEAEVANTADMLKPLLPRISVLRERMAYNRDNLPDKDSLSLYDVELQTARDNANCALEQIEELQAAVDRRIRLLSDLKQLEVAEDHLNSAKEGISLARTASHLTVLAFIFVPLNFSTSVFAMHIKPLGFDDGAVPLWYFVALAFPLELVALVVLLRLSGSHIDVVSLCLRLSTVVPRRRDLNILTGSGVRKRKEGEK